MTSTASRTSGSRELLIRAAVTAVVLGTLAVLIFVLPRYRWAWHLVWRGDRVGTFLGAMWTTGAMSPGMRRMSQVPGWVPLKVFSESTEYTVRRGRTAASASLASNP